MASGADGSIIIDTQLDNTGFQRGSKQMQNAVNSLNNSVNQTGQNMAGAVQSMNTALQNMGNAAQMAGSKFTQYLGAGQFDKAIGEVQRSANSLVSDLARIGNAEAAGVKPGAQYQKLITNIQEAEQELATLREQMAQLGGQTFNTTEFTQLQQQIEKAEQALFKLYDRRDMLQELGVDHSTQSWKALEINIRNAEEELERLERSRDAMVSNGTATMGGADTAQYQQLLAQYQQMEAALETYKQAAAGFNVIEDPANQSTAALQNVDNELKQKGPDAETAKSGLSSFGSALASIAGFAFRAAGGLARLTFHGVVSGAKTAATGIGRFVSSLKNLRKQSGQSALTSNGLVKSLLGVKRMLLTRIKRTFISALFNSLKNGLHSFAKYSSAFNASMSAMKNSMTGMSGNIAVFAGNLVNAIAPAISTIIDWISKAISYLNAFFALLSGKSTYTVAKKGTDDYAKSLKGAGGAAKNLKDQVYGFDELNRADDNSGGGGGSGSGVDFTEESLENLPSSLKNFMDSLKEAFAAGEFEKVGEIVATGLNSIITTVDDWINDKFRPFATKWARNIARIMNGFVSAFDWTNLGKLFADGFNAIVDTVNNFLTTFDFDALAKAFGNGINGLTKNIDWALLGRTIGNGISNLKNLIWGTLASINWTQLGSGLATGVNNMFAAIDWAKYAKNVSDSLKGIINGINQFMLDTDWQAIGDDIATFISNIDWNGLCDALMNGIGIALASIGELIWGIIKPAWDSVVAWWNETMDKNGGDVIKTLLEGIVTALKNIGQWCLDHIIKPILNGIESALGLEQGTILNTATQLWTTFKTSIETAWETIKTAVSTFFTGVWATIVGFFGTLGDTAKNIWSDFTSSLSAGWEAIKQAVSTTVSGAWSTITGFFGTLGDKAKAIWSDFTSNLSAGWNAIKQAVSTTVSGAWSTITGFFGTLGDKAKAIWSDFTTGISSGWSAIKEAVTNTVKGAWDAIKGVFTGIGDVATNIWNGLKQGLSDGWTKLKESLLKPFKDMWQAVKNFFGIASPSTEAASIGDFILQGLVQGFETAVTTVCETVKRIFGRIWDAIKSIFGFGSESEESKEAKQAGKDIMTGMKDGIKGDEETVKKEIANAGKIALQALRSEVGVPENGGASTKTKTIGESVMTGLSDGIIAKSTEETFKNAGNKAWEAVKKALNTAFGTKENGSASKSKYVGETTVQGINDGIDSKAKEGTFKTVADNTIKAIKAALNKAFGMASDTASATKSKGSGEGIVKGISDGIKDKAVEGTFTSVANAVRDAAGKAFSTALGISGGGWFSSASSSKFKDVGKAICQGIADGIDANTSTIKSAAERAAQAALNAAKAKLGISSPSKVFAEIGGYMMEGMSLGLEDGQGEVEKTISQIAESITKGMGGTTFDVGAEAMVSGMDQVADKLMSFVDRLNAAANALVDGMLQQPAIATGSYTPPRVRVDETGSTTDNIMTELRKLASDRDEDESNLRDLVRELIEVVRNKNMNFDGSSLERTLDSIRRDRVRSFGGAY